MKKVLLVDDDAAFLDACSALLRALGYCVTTAASLAAARLAVQADAFQALLLDLMLPDGSGLQLLELMGSVIPADTAVVIMTGHPAIKQTIKSMYGPHIDYLLKPVSMAELRNVLEKRIDTASCDTDIPEQDSFDALIGSSAPMLEVYEAIRRVAQTSANVMLLGESGVGKELVAKAIHNQSRVTGHFIATNCGGFSRELIGSELFGHEKGAFTGATGRKQGVFEQAAGGTLFLDEITEMAMELQPHLLRVLDNRKFVRLGGVTPLEVGCRIISATNRDVMSIVHDNCLRQDLLFRLAVFPITIPPLRERAGDIPLLVEYFLDKFNQERNTNIRCTPAVLAQLQEYEWPGNVRELRHTLQRAHIMTEADAELAPPEHLGLCFAHGDVHTDDLRIHFGQSIEEMEKHLITVTLGKLGGDKKAAAHVLGVSLKTLYNRLRTYENQDRARADITPFERAGAGK